MKSFEKKKKAYKGKNNGALKRGKAKVDFFRGKNKKEKKEK